MPVIRRLIKWGNAGVTRFAHVLGSARGVKRFSCPRREKKAIEERKFPDEGGRGRVEERETSECWF